MKTLIVEDDVSIRLLLQRILERFGVCHCAVHGAEAVEAFDDALAFGHPFDLVCLDIMMPGMDGLEALRRMRAAEERAGRTAIAGARIIMVTALSDYRHISQAHAGLCTDYLVKPFETARLLAMLHEHGLIPADAPGVGAAGDGPAQ